jgi:CubicO group peptidase (beta-lactamase class C family)
MSKVQGDYDERFSPLRDLFQENLDAEEELGASLAVVRNGVLLVDLWGGWTDIEHSAPWVEDTITVTWSARERPNPTPVLSHPPAGCCG